MKKFLIIAGCIITGVAVLSCNRTRRNTGRAYMPDMVYSVAYETYAPTEERLSKYGAHYNNHPVEGTIARNEMFPYAIKNDTAGYTQSAAVKNPLSSLNSKEYLEASRLYLVNCGICHGSKLDGNGPLYNDGKGPFSAAPKNLLNDDMKKLADGTMFHSITYGKGQMGSYASQLNTMQRWMIITYIREKQNATAVAGTTAPADSTATSNLTGDTTKAMK